MKLNCKRCLYDEDTPSITFDSEGICNYCKIHEQVEAEYKTGKEGEKTFERIASEIRISGHNKKYDCLVGVSGGCDSSFTLYKIKEMGLRPLAVHFDNTWDSTTAVKNIYKVLKGLNVDLFTYVVDNKEMDDIFRSFMLSGTPDIDTPTDIGAPALLYMAAEKYGVKYIIEGHSFRTEGISPLGWLYMDAKYIESVHKKFGKVKMKTFPNLWLISFLKWTVLRQIKRIRPLWYISYNKEETKKILSKEFGWEWYGGHHLENRWTAFYHSYFLPRRFGIDQRLNGYSALIRSGQLTREKAAELMRQQPYLEPEILELVKKRLGFTDEKFEQVMSLPKKTYRDYKTYKKTFEYLRPFFWLMYKTELVPKSFYMKYTTKHIL